MFFKSMRKKLFNTQLCKKRKNILKNNNLTYFFLCLDIRDAPSAVCDKDVRYSDL